MIAKQLRTRAGIVSRARKLTAEVGLAGFTVQQLTDDVGISRRTFFNYFPSKESAVLGIENGIDEALLERFAAARRVPVCERRHLVDDLADIAVSHFDVLSPTATDLDDLLTALQREPRLLQALIQSGRSEQRRFIELLVASDPAHDHDSAEVAAVTFEALVRLSVDHYLRADNDTPFPAILRHRLSLARTLFSPVPSLTPSKVLEPTE